MAEALLINRSDITKKTSLNGNVDTDKFIPYIKIAQDTYIQNILGTKLLNKIKADIVAGTLSGDYLDLVTDYIKPMLIHWAMVEYLPWAAYTVANKGVYKHGAENSESVDKNEVDFLVEKQRSMAQHYTERFQDYMCFNQTDFPEWNQNTNEDMFPSDNEMFGGWAL